MNLEKMIGYTFKNKNLLKIAMTHSSYAHEIDSKKYNEKVEFLGDAVLELISSEYIFNEHQNLSEGEMTKARAYAVCEDALAEVAKKFSFSDFLLVGKCESKIKGEYRNSLLADSVEAVIGSIYLDAGFEEAKKFILPYIIKKVDEFIKMGNKDYKTQLQELLQAKGDIKIEYEIIDSSGPEHNKIFTAEVRCNGKLLGCGKGKNKKEAEMDAAKMALNNAK